MQRRPGLLNRTTRDTWGVSSKRNMEGEGARIQWDQLLCVPKALPLHFTDETRVPNIEPWLEAVPKITPISPICTVPGHLPPAFSFFHPHLHLQHKAHSAESKGALNLAESLFYIHKHTHINLHISASGLFGHCKCKHSPVASRQSQISKEPQHYQVNLLSDWN